MPIHTLFLAAAALFPRVAALPHDTASAAADARAVVVTGRVIDDAALPVADADVRARGAGDERHVRTDAAGRYVVRLARAGDRIEIIVRHVGQRPARFTLTRGGAARAEQPLVGDVQLAATGLPVPEDA